MSQIYTVEIDGQQVDIEGDRPPNETEARTALAAHTSAPLAQASAMSRFMAPIAEAAKGAAHLPAALAHGAGRFINATEALAAGDPSAMVDVGGDIAHGVADPAREQFRKADEAGAAGNYSEGLGHVAAGLIPVVGPAAADAGETMASGDIAGGLGKAAVTLAPFARAPKFAEGLSTLMKNRANARILGVMRPDLARMATAEKIAPEVVSGVEGRELAGGIGVGSRAKLAQRAKARAMQAGDEINALQSLPQRVNPAPISKSLRGEAAAKETTAPSGQVFTEDPALVEALRAHANKVDEMASAFGGDVPAGELFKQRAVLGKKLGNKVANGLPGDMTTAQVEAGTARNAQTSKLLHDEIPGSKVVDNEYHVMQNAYINLERSRLRDMLGRGGKEVMQLLAGRLAGGAAGMAAGYASGGGHIAGMAGAVGGVYLGESAYWGSLRAATYNQIAKALKAGDIDTAATIIQRTGAAYSIAKAERHRRAAAALRTQAEGSPTP